MTVRQIAYISLTPDHKRALIDAAAATTGGNVSLLVRQMIERDRVTKSHFKLRVHTT